MAVYGIAVLGFFSCSISVSSSSAVCSFSSFWMTVISEIRLFTVLWYRLFARGHHLQCGNFFIKRRKEANIIPTRISLDIGF